MNRFLLVAGLICFSAFAKAQQHQQPNIVYILADDLGIGDVSGLNANAKVRTPNIDALIDNGMTFTDAHTTSSVCTPSRYSIMTGQYSWRTSFKAGVLDGYSPALIKDSIDTTPELLQRSGYETAMIGKWHLGWNWEIKQEEKNTIQSQKALSENVDYSKPFTGGPVDHGFDYYYGLNASLDFPPYAYSENNKLIMIPTETMKYDGRDNNFPGGKQKDLVGGQKMKRNGDKAEGFTAEQVMLDLTNKSVEYINDYKSDKPFFLYVPLTAPHTPVYPRDEFLGTSSAGIYGDFIQELDWTVGQIVAAIKEKGLEEDTMIIFTADNGASRASFPVEFEKMYNHQPSAHLRGRKATLHQGGHTVPLIVQWKKHIEPNTTNKTTISLADLYATCAELLDVETDKNQGVDSYSILSLLKGGDDYPREASIYTNFAGRYSIRKDDWKMDMNPQKGKSYLFHISEVPSEKNNLFYEDDDIAIAKKKQELTITLNKIILDGRSTEGEKLKNDGPEVWKQLFWMKKDENKMKYKSKEK